MDALLHPTRLSAHCQQAGRHSGPRTPPSWAQNHPREKSQPTTFSNACLGSQPNSQSLGRQTGPRLPPAWAQFGPRGTGCISEILTVDLDRMVVRRFRRDKTIRPACKPSNPSPFLSPSPVSFGSRTMVARSLLMYPAPGGLPAPVRSVGDGSRPRPSPLSFLLLSFSHFFSSPAREIQRANTHGGRRRSRRRRGATGRRARSPEGERAAVERPLGGALRSRVTRTAVGSPSRGSRSSTPTRCPMDRRRWWQRQVSHR
jgi:hypothetical protein